MIPDWPATLPQALEVAGYSQAAADTLLRTSMDAGPAKVRRRFTAGVRPVSGRVTVEAAQLVDLDTFYRDTLLGGSLRFAWTDPEDDQTAVEMRFTSPPVRTALGAGLYRVALELEILP